ncbi:MmcB family DNA repair protein [Campylobacter lari]|uniref:MmcB family DNA repair protein n=1 Tax=Campylobacter lari TaxID=201 RepID=UPI003703D60C
MELVSSEVSLMGGKRFIDILTVEGSQVIAYEIKSKKDNLSKLEKQLEDYLKIFDKVYVILDKKFEKKIENIPKNVGIIIFDSNNNFVLRKHAKKNSPIQYYQSLFISKNYLRKYRKNNNDSLFAARHYVIQNIPKQKFKKMVLEGLREYFLEGFLLFKEEIEKNSNIIHPDDISLLKKRFYMKVF